jgi:hypothetical protein
MATTPLVVGRDHYMSRVKNWRSLMGFAVDIANTAALTFLDLVKASGLFSCEADGVALAGSDGVETTFSGNIFTSGAFLRAGEPATADPNYPVLIIPESITLAFTDNVAWAENVTDDGAGVLTGDAGTPASGTVDYETGEWTVTFNDTPPPEDSVYDINASLYYAFEEGDIQGLWIAPITADAVVYATFDGVTLPEPDNSGIPITEPMFLAAQPNLIFNMQVIADDNPHVWFELLV